MAKSLEEQVNHPDYYEGSRKFKPYQVIRDWGLNFNEGCVVKYVARKDKPNESRLKDLIKARNYLDFEIEAVKGELENGKSN